MTRERPTGRGHRREQLAAELREVIQDALTRGLSDPRVRGLITITSLEVAADLATAAVWVSVLPEKNQVKVIAGLRHAAKHLRHEAGVKITSVKIPELRFELDVSLKKQAAVIQALGRVAAEREQAEALLAEQSAAGAAGGGGGEIRSPWHVDPGARAGKNPDLGGEGGRPPGAQSGPSPRLKTAARSTRSSPASKSKRKA